MRYRDLNNSSSKITNNGNMLISSSKNKAMSDCLRALDFISNEKHYGCVYLHPNSTINSTTLLAKPTTPE